MKKLRLILLLAIVLTAGFLRRACPEEADQWVPTAIHIATTVSDGNLSIDDVLRAARIKGIKAVVITDRDVMKWEYGIWPLRYILKRTVEMGSVFKVGINKYLKDIELESRMNKDIVIIPGVESAPFYHWQGIPFSGSFKLLDWHKHILVIGLQDPNDYKALPNVANPWSLRRPFGATDIWRLWPFLILAFGLLLARKRECDYADAKGRQLCGYSKKWLVTGCIIFIFGILALVCNNPFYPVVYDQYSGGAGMKPYQMLIDHVNNKGGMTFWAHPEAKNISQEGGVKIETTDHVEDLWKTKDYTGYAIFYDGYERLGKPGGEWDRLLREYCQGRRSRPVWALAGLAFDNGTFDDLLHLMDDARTYILTSTISRASLLDAMRRGRMYVSRGKGSLFLDAFIVRDELDQHRGQVGSEIALSGAPVIEIRGHLLDSDASGVEVRLIRDGKIIEIFRPAGPLDITYKDVSIPKGKHFYRLEMARGPQLIVTNPIFVTEKRQ